MTKLPENVKVARTESSGGITRYDVFVDETRIGELWKCDGRSFSGAWRGQVDGEHGRFVNWRHTRHEVVSAMIGDQ